MKLIERIAAIKRKNLIIISATVGFMFLGLILAPAIYRYHANRCFISELNSRFGPNGWVVIEMGADNQYGEQINLYRTLYVKWFYPRYRKYTPWRNLEFTHKTTVPTKPWHYYIHVAANESWITLYWSMSEDKWIIAWEDPVIFWEREKYNELVSGFERRNGFNYSKKFGRHHFY